MDIQDKLQACKQQLADLGKVTVAFSGGVDSSFLLALAVDARCGQRASGHRE